MNSYVWIALLSAVFMGWPQMEQMLARVTMLETAERQGAQAS